MAMTLKNNVILSALSALMYLLSFLFMAIFELPGSSNKFYVLRFWVF